MIGIERNAFGSYGFVVLLTEKNLPPTVCINRRYMKTNELYAYPQLSFYDVNI